MGRRRSKRKPAPKKKLIEKLETFFACPFCNHEKSCEVKMDRDRNTAAICCNVCTEEYQTTINYLSEPIDVYSDWIDACESANQWNYFGFWDFELLLTFTCSKFFILWVDKLYVIAKICIMLSCTFLFFLMYLADIGLAKCLLQMYMC